MSIDEKIRTISPELIDTFKKFVDEYDGLQVLIVDDQESIRTISRDLLLDLGCEVDTASSGAEFVEKVQAKNYDLALVDQLLPDGNLVDFLKQLDNMGFDPRSLAWSMVTAYKPTDDYAQYGMRYRFTKPFYVTDLLHFVMKSVDLQQREYNRDWFIAELKRLDQYRKGLSVLFVDDQKTVRVSVADQLEDILTDIPNSNYHVMGTGQEALNLLCDLSPSIVFWDFMLESSTASEYLERLRRLQEEGILPESDTIHIYVTDKDIDEPELLHAYGDLGVQNKITKPFSTGDLAAIIIKELDFRRRTDYQKQIELSREKFVDVLARSHLHTINNKLTGLVGHIDILYRHLDGVDMSPDKRDICTLLRERIDSNAELVTRYVREIRMLYRSGIESKSFDMKKVASIAANSLMRDDTQVSMNFTDSDLSLYGYEDGFLSAFLDLGMNAIQAGAKSITFGLCDGKDELGDYVQAYVQDDGSGIEPENLERVFDIGYTTKSGECRGSGLALVKKTMDMHNARVWCESKVGQGTVFYFRIYT